MGAVLDSLEETYLAACTDEWDAVFAEWRTGLVTLGQFVRRSDPGGVEQGLAVDVDRDGALLIKRDDEYIVRILAGTIVSLEGRDSDHGSA